MGTPALPVALQPQAGGTLPTLVLYSVSSTEFSLINHATDKHGSKISLFLMAVVCFFNLWLLFFLVFLYIWIC